MRFGKTLTDSIYPPWKSHYIDYARLKVLLREDDKGDSPGQRNVVDEWTEADESAFVEELVNVQLEKVNTFQVDIYGQLRERTSKCESRLEALQDWEQRRRDGGQDGEDREKLGGVPEEESQRRLTTIRDELDAIARDLSELEKFSRVNFTGFLKAAKKHDRKRGRKYRVRPLLQVRLGALPFNSEDYSPLLYRLSTMYSFVHQNLDGASKTRPSHSSETLPNQKHYVSHKFWVHPDNLLEVKTYILRRLPLLVYNPQTSKNAEGGQRDPAITSLYFDNPNFSLYTKKLERATDASSLRLRWYGQLSQRPEIFLEKKTMQEDGSSEETKFSIKEKYIRAFISGDYKMEKTIQKMRDRNGHDDTVAEDFRTTVDAIQSFIRDNDLQPLLRANYTRTAFQIPGDNRVRISLDTNLALIREDVVDSNHPHRSINDWHRTDIDDASMEHPFDTLPKGEVYRFPYAVLEIKIRPDSSRKRTEWVHELMSSHLVKEAPRFSKFVDGVAQLFEDYVNSFPFWLSEIENDIRKDPKVAFEQEQEKKAKQADDELAVGSFLGSNVSPPFKPAISSPVDHPYLPSPNTRAKLGASPKALTAPPETRIDDPDSDEEGTRITPPHSPSRSRSSSPSRSQPRFRSLLPTLSTSKYARRHLLHRRGSSIHSDSVTLPPHIHPPGPPLKNAGPLQIEPKVWLANQRTFIKWQHVAVLLASLSLGLFNASTSGSGSGVARGLGLAYLVVAAFTAAWGWWIFVERSRAIADRSGRELDSVLGPVAVCVALVVGLWVNFGLKYREATRRTREVGGVDFNETGGVWGAGLQQVLGR
ncbi:MAG: Phosphate metabolism transcription protein [Piccolia ochrophora]|nr:MAG: Phosphate metabolism transcription protein [Piccolia ochrophora]